LKGQDVIIKVLGTGCSKCKLLTKRLEEIKQNHQLNFQLESVTQLDDIMSYGVMMTPGLVIDEKLKAVGKVPNEQQILNWIQEA